MKNNNISISSKFADPNGKVMIVQVKGYIDQANCEQLQKVLDDIVVSECFNVVFDLSELYYMSSAGWGIFVGEIRRFREHNGDIKIARMSPEVGQVFQMLEFYHIIEEYSTIDEALDAFGVDGGQKLKKEKVKVAASVSKKKGKAKLKVVEEKHEMDEEEAFLEQIKEEATEILNDDEVDAEIEIDPIPIRREQEADLVDFFKPRRPIPLEKLPIQEKVKKIVGEFPLIGLLSIRKMLRHKDFGDEKISLFRLYRVLKEINLETKEKRYRYYRSV